MDPYSAEGELVNIHSAFHQGQYKNVVDFDTSSFSSENTLPAQILKYRARLALGEYDEVLSEVKGDSSSPDVAAVGILAEYLKAPGEESKAVAKAQELAQKEADNLTVELLCGTVLAAANLVDEALALLAKHQGSLDAYVLCLAVEMKSWIGANNRTESH
jgi:coatomer protein complex subunit epsilon